MGQLYLDYAATTPVHPDVAAVMLEMLRERWGNPSSIHATGREARRALDEARRRVAELVGAPHYRDIIFTSGGTEADNLAVLGAARARAEEGRRHVVTSAVEHHAVLDACRALSAEGFDVTIVPVDGEGFVDPDEVRRALRPDTALVTVMLANNEVGTIQPVAEIARAAHEVGAWVHTDAVQAAGQIPIDVQALDVDLLSLSAHKIYGPKGAGALYVRSGLRLKPLVFGGGQERAWRPGTENAAGLVGLGKAAELARAALEAGEPARLTALRDRLIDGILERVPGARLNGPRGRGRLPNNVHVSLEDVDGEALLVHLDLAGLAASSGSACTSGSLEPSHVLLALGLPRELAAAGLRLTLGRPTTEDEIERALAILEGAVARVRKVRSA
ncbi:MAG: cysteine desulfurase [Firmicutes bacterium]|nr:cysteine desulfurase [Bacillota bacterium]